MHKNSKLNSLLLKFLDKSSICLLFQILDKWLTNPFCIDFISRTEPKSQNCLYTQWHTTSQRNDACDVGSATSSLILPKAHPRRDTRLRLACMVLVLQTISWMDSTPDLFAKWINCVNYGSGCARLTTMCLSFSGSCIWLALFQYNDNLVWWVS